MKQDFELIKLILQTLADNDCYYMRLDDLAKIIQEKTREAEPFSDKFVGHFFLAKDTNLVSELGFVSLLVSNTINLFRLIMQN